MIRHFTLLILPFLLVGCATSSRMDAETYNLAMHRLNIVEGYCLKKSAPERLKLANSDPSSKTIAMREGTMSKYVIALNDSFGKHLLIFSNPAEAGHTEFGEFCGILMDKQDPRLPVTRWIAERNPPAQYKLFATDKTSRDGNKHTLFLAEPRDPKNRKVMIYNVTLKDGLYFVGASSMDVSTFKKASR